MRDVLQAGPPLVTASAKHVASQVPIAGLFGSDDVKTSYNNFHQLKAKDIDGNEVNFADLNGKVGQHANYQLKKAWSPSHACVWPETGHHSCLTYAITDACASRCRSQRACCIMTSATSLSTQLLYMHMHVCEDLVAAWQKSYHAFHASARTDQSYTTFCLLLVKLLS